MLSKKLLLLYAIYPIPSAARLGRIPAKSGSMVSCGPGSAMMYPLIRRASKSGVGIAGAGMNAVFSVKPAAWLVARKRNAAQIDKAIAFNMAKAQPGRPDFSVAKSVRPYRICGPLNRQSAVWPFCETAPIAQCPGLLRMVPCDGSPTIGEEAICERIADLPRRTNFRTGAACRLGR